MEIKINVDDYLNDEDKKEIASDAFRRQIEQNLIEKLKDKKSNYDNYERVISNSIHHFLEEKIDSILDCDTNEMIKENVLKTIKKSDYSYSLFRTKNAWEKEDSPAQKIVKEAIESHKEVMTEKIHNKLNEAIDEIGIDTVHEMFSDIFDNFLSNRLSDK